MLVITGGKGFTVGMATKTEAYFKIQFRDPISLAWKDIQKAFASAEEAQAAFAPDKECRVMCITPKGRFPL